MAFDPDAYLAKKKAPKADDFDAEAFLASFDKEPSAQKQAPKQRAPLPTGIPAELKPTGFDFSALPPDRPKTQDESALDTTTATNRTEGKRERIKAGREMLRTERAVEQVGAAGYGLARGATLGAVDRLVGLGTAIGERLAGTPENPANPNAYEEARRDYLQGEDDAKRDYPKTLLAGELAGGVAPTIALAPLSLAKRAADAGKAVQFGARAADAALLGGAAGALNTRPDDAAAIARGAGFGALAGIVGEATLGTLARRAIRPSVERQENAVIRDVVESEAGRATPTSSRKLAKDIDDVRSVLREDQELSKAMRLPAREAAPVIDAKVEQAMAGQSARYQAIDETIGKPLTMMQLLTKLVKAEEGIPAKRLTLVKKGLQGLRDAIREDFGPKWGGEAFKGQRIELSTQQLREWVSSVQATAEAAMGSINGTNAAKVPEDLARIANSILEERLDLAASKGAKAIVDQIREADRRTSALLNIKRAVDDRGWKEIAQASGISKRIADEQQAQRNAAAAGLAVSGNVPAAVGVASGGALKRFAGWSLREINDQVLAPIQRAAEAGKSWAEIMRLSAEVGMPQSLARTIFERAGTNKDMPTIPVDIARPAPDAPSAPVPFVAPPTPIRTLDDYPRDHAITMRTR